MKPFEPGQKVRVQDGVFANFTGEVKEIAVEKKRLKVSVILLSRPIEIELDFNKVQRLA